MSPATAGTRGGDGCGGRLGWTRGRRRARSAWLPGAVLLLGVTATLLAAGRQFGSVAFVQGEVLAIEQGKLDRQLQRGDPVTEGLRVRLTQQGSVLRVLLFGEKEAEKPIKTVGCFTLSSRSEVTIQGGPVSGGLARATSTILLYLGLGNLRLSLLPHRELLAVVRTPQMTAKIEGTDLRAFSDPAIGTYLAVYEGVVSVQAEAGGDPVEVRAGGWVLVPPGALPTRPVPLRVRDGILEDPPLLGCCTQVEGPKPPRR
jgi:hypothetical protein